MNDYCLTIIGHIHNDFKEKFGIPRQSGRSTALSRVVFTPEFRLPDAVRGLEGFSHIWLLWLFSENMEKGWSPTVRPPRLGGNKRMGVFATRSPFRPNFVGMSSVRLNEIRHTSDGPVLIVEGADIMDGTPIIDIKPYVPYSDCYTDATGGFSDPGTHRLEVEIPGQAESCFTPEQLECLRQILSDDPRPAYHDDPMREYTFSFGEYEITFRADDRVLTVINCLHRRI